VSALPLRGRILRSRTRDAFGLEYFAYLPVSAAEDAPLLVAVHGFTRNAAEQAELFAPLCDAAGFALVAPLFEAAQFPNYQRLGLRRRRADHALDSLVGELRVSFELLFGRVSLFGFSGGGQFVHRYALAHPKRVASAAVAAPGWFTFPTHEQRYPLGLGGTRRKLGLRLRAERFSLVPLLVAVGEHDVDPHSEYLRHSPALDAQQGTTRIERAARWVHAMHEAALAAGCTPRVRFTEIPNAGHSFADCMENGLGELVLEHAGASLANVSRSCKRLVALP
jgi:pimeloyl-ACP methyl ester carboxylesterase